MRQYRGLTKDGKWVYGSLVKIYDRRYIARNPEVSYSDDSTEKYCTIWGFVEVIPETVGQSTGLKCKDKIELYFDDMVIWNKKKYVIVWNKTCLGIYLEHLDSYLARKKDSKKGKFIENLMYGRAVYLEIIGNVHQTEKPK